MVQYISQPLSRYNLRNYAFQLRKLLNVEKQLYFPVMEFLEVLPDIFSQLSWEIVEDTEFPQFVHGETDVLNHYIKIRQSVYDGAYEGNGRTHTGGNEIVGGKQQHCCSAVAKNRHKHRLCQILLAHFHRNAMCLQVKIEHRQR